tara:strand:+ start:228 stop:365 length:138 start_codon:yes stop_codon:yes gene_type:complete
MKFISSSSESSSESYAEDFFCLGASTTGSATAAPFLPFFFPPAEG